MAETEIREERMIWPVAGVGGFLEVEWARDPATPDQTGYVPPGATGEEAKPGKGEKLEVERWNLLHKFVTVDQPLSGGKGALSNRRVADSFVFACEVSLCTRATKQARNLPGDNSPFSREPFVDGMLQGLASNQALFHVGVRFQCGDPSFWGHPETQPIPIATSDKGLFYFCPRVGIESVEPTNSAKGNGVVAYVVRGKGSAPLERWINDVQVGFGGLGFVPPA